MLERGFLETRWEERLTSRQKGRRRQGGLKRRGNWIEGRKAESVWARPQGYGKRGNQVSPGQGDHSKAEDQRSENIERVSKITWTRRKCAWEEEARPGGRAGYCKRAAKRGETRVRRASKTEREVMRERQKVEGKRRKRVKSRGRNHGLET